MPAQLPGSQLVLDVLEGGRLGHHTPDAEPARRLVIGERLVDLAQRSGAGDVLTLGFQDFVLDLKHSP